MNKARVTILQPRPIPLWNVVGVLAVMLMLFPWVSFNILKLDTQPWYIIVGIFFILLSVRKRIPFSILFGYTLPFVGFFIVILHYDKFDLLSLRAIASYIGFVVSVHAYFLYKKYFPDPNQTLLVAANYIWLCAGIMQIVFGKYIFDSIVWVRTTDTRGVTSLAPEPTFFGIVLVFISWLIWIESGFKLKRHGKLLLFLNFLGILFVAKSGMAIVFGMVFAILYLFVNLVRPKIFLKKLILIPLLIFSVVMYANFNSNSRISQLYATLINSKNLIMVDASINSRLAHIILPIQGAITDFGYPHGYHSYSSKAESLAAKYNGLFWYKYSGNKIMSGVSSIIFETGFLGIFFFVYVVWLLWDPKIPRISFLNISVYFLFMSAAIPISFPLSGMVLAAAYYQKRSSQTVMHSIILTKAKLRICPQHL